ncbi:MAG: hypothetical protein J5611_00040 [Alphaproteobacteria bacterium]|nr:hypothetical protein [Alphaproteobacteria bacterium]
MKKLLFVILSLFAVVAYADNTITSKEYVDGQVSSLQTQIPAKNTNTVITNTGNAGTIGEKAIYDASNDYVSQQDALVTAGTFNSAVQNALESEFVCVEWLGDVHDNAHCLLYAVRAARKNILDPATIHHGTIAGANGHVLPDNFGRCYFDYIPVHAGDTVIFTAKENTPPVYGSLFIYSASNEESYRGEMSGGDSVSIGDHVGYKWTIPYDCYMRGLFLSNEYDFNPEDIVEPMVEISTTPSPYESYNPVYLPSGN